MKDAPVLRTPFSSTPSRRSLQPIMRVLTTGSTLVVGAARLGVVTRAFRARLARAGTASRIVGTRVVTAATPATRPFVRLAAFLGLPRGGAERLSDRWQGRRRRESRRRDLYDGPSRGRVRHTRLVPSSETHTDSDDAGRGELRDHGHRTGRRRGL